MRAGRRVDGFPSLPEARAHAAASLARLPGQLRRLETEHVPVQISLGIRRLAAEMDRTAGHKP
jgi:nicotinate phosphoribosyltransferase